MPNNRILLVDDEPLIINFVAIKLKSEGFEVACAENGEDALGMVKTVKPDLILLDILMPKIDGLEMLRELRKFSKVPVIVISAKSEVSRQVIEMGANGFIAKPFDPDVLIARIKSVLKPVYTN
jgi:DNA-binding response OmpR family regulator